MSDNSLTGKVLVLGTDFKNYRSCLAIIRSLGRKGLKIDLAWNAPDDIARRSKYVAKIYDLPPFSLDDDSWKKDLIELIDQQRYDLVVPCNEQASAPLEADRPAFAKYPAVYLLNQKAYEIAFDKFKSGDLAESLGISVPRGKRIAGIDEIDAILSEFQFPVVLKPTISFSLESLHRKNYVYKAYNRKELFTAMRHLLKGGDVLVQENFIGAGAGIEFIAREGELLYAFQHVRLHEALMGGGSSYRKSAPCHPDLFEATRKLIKVMDYTGVGMAEYKIDFGAHRPQPSDKWVFLEINGRFWGSLPLAVAAGADFPYFLYCLKTGAPLKFPSRYKTKLYARNTIRDFVWITENIFADKTDPSRNTVPNGTVAMELLRLITLREKNDTWVIDDLKPGFLEFARLFKIKMALGRRILITFSPWRILRSFAARQALYKAKSVLVVCFGNIYRSPFAERYLRKKLPQSVAISSAGYFPRSGRSCHQRAIDIAAEFDVEMEGHRSKIIALEMVEKADIILIFDKENQKTLKSMFPSAASKIFPLGLLAFAGPVYFDDPVESNLYTVRSGYRAIKAAIDSFAKRY